MRHCALATLFFAIWCSSAFGTTYYVANAGSDAANGTNTGTPWKTIAKVNGSSFSAGDSILFNKGDRWREQLTVPSSGSAGNVITVGAYGSGAQPIIDGSDVETGWVADTGATVPVDIETFETGAISAFWSTSPSGGVADTVNFKTGTTSWQFPGTTNTYESRGGLASNYGEFISWIRIDSTSTLANGQLTNLVQFEGPAWTGGSNGVVLIVDHSGGVYRLSAGRTGIVGATPYTISTNTWYAVRLCVTANNGTGNAHAELYVQTAGETAPWGSAVSTLTGMTLASQMNQLLRFGKQYSNLGSVLINYDDVYIYTSDSTASGTPQANVYTVLTLLPVNQVFSSGVRLTQASSKAALVDGQWFSAGYLYIQSNAGNPDTLGMVIEASQRTDGIKINGKNYITVSGLTCTKGNYHCINLGNGSEDHIIITGNTLTYSASDGVLIYSAAGGMTNSLITQNTMAWNGGQGIYLLGPTSASNTMSQNTIYNNCQIYAANGTGNLADNQYCGGIRLLADLGTGNVITQNLVYNNGYDAGGSPITGNATAVGIWIDCGAGTGTASSEVISYNLTYNNAFDGIRVEDCSNESVLYNVSYGNVRSSPQSGGVTVGSYNHIYPTSNNLIYGNTSYGNRVGLNFLGYSTGGAGGYTNNTIKNNLAIGSLSMALQAEFGSDNDGTMGFGNVYTYNGLGVQGANFIAWGGSFGTFYSTYAAWQGATGAGIGVTDHYLSSDPLFTNTSTGDFTLQSSSPAINVGANLGSTYQMALWPSSTWPVGVVTANENSYGAGWDIGAFIGVFGSGSGMGTGVSLGPGASIH